MEEFKRLWAAFKKGSAELGTARITGKTVFYGMEVQRFQREVVDPMDAAWRALTKEEQDKWAKENVPF